MDSYGLVEAKSVVSRYGPRRAEGSGRILDIVNIMNFARRLSQFEPLEFAARRATSDRE
jgi:hypothetical protein